MGESLDVLSELALQNGLEVEGALKEMLDMREFMKQNLEVVDHIGATITMMEVLGNTSYLSQEIFTQFQLEGRRCQAKMPIILLARSLFFFLLQSFNEKQKSSTRRDIGDNSMRH